MTIEIKPGRYFARFFFFGGEGVDWLCALWKDPDPGSLWTIQYRFRYYVDESGDPNAPDDKSWYCWTFPPDTTEAEAEERTERFARDARDIMQEVRLEVGLSPLDELEFISVHSDDVEVVARLLYRQSWSHPVQSARGGVA